MRTNVDIDEELLREAFKLSDNTTKKDLIHEALYVFISVKKRKNLKDIKGKISFRKNYDYKKLRVG